MASRLGTSIAATILLVTGITGIAGCTADAPEGTGTPRPTRSATPEPYPEVTAPNTPEAPDTPDAPALPEGFPDPASLIGQVVHDEPDATGTWRTVVGGTPLELVNTLGACFDGGSGDICGYSVSVSVPDTATPLPASAALVLLLRHAESLPDGTATWVVLDAVAQAAPGGEPAYISTCDGTDGVVIWVPPDAGSGETLPVLGAVGPDAGVTAFVEVDPGTLSCPSPEV